MPSLQGHVPFLLLSDLTLSASICAHLAPCLPRVRILLVESVLPGFPPPADGSGRTVHARCVQLALRASVPVRRRLRSCCCFESFQHLPIRLPFACRPCRVGGEQRPSLRNRFRIQSGSCLESFERSVRSGFLRKGRPSSQIRHRFLVLLLLL